MAVEDFTAYTEVDNDSTITVTPSKVDVVADEGQSGSYVRSDKGANHFGDFEHLITVYCNSATTIGSSGVVWAINNLSDTWYKMAVNNNEGEALKVENDRVDVARFWLEDHDSGNNDFGDLQARDTPYYCTIKRAGTTLTCEIYSDAARTTLVDTLTLTSDVVTYRWIYAYICHGYFTDTTTHYCENLDLQEVVAPIVKRRRGRMSYGLKPARVVRPGRIGV